MFIIIGFLWVLFVGLPIIAGRVSHLNALEDAVYERAYMKKGGFDVRVR